LTLADRSIHETRCSLRVVPYRYASFDTSEAIAIDITRNRDEASEIGAARSAFHDAALAERLALIRMMPRELTASD